MEVQAAASGELSQYKDDMYEQLGFLCNYHLLSSLHTATPLHNICGLVLHAGRLRQLPPSLSLRPVSSAGSLSGASELSSQQHENSTGIQLSAPHPDCTPAYTTTASLH